ncbi:MAG: DUF3300 domain-containing protein [Betaproteobacteria bacterium]|nr:MAG: DUF3300 domain-containing protein [Betaproteobacteria bacterium]TMI08705.1 MAG: DUF3300 domain-containing protein [Betaproteobacteria bacterium]
MRTLLLALCLLLPLAPAHAQQRLYSQPELDALLAPVALYPDPLLSQILAAAVYPDQVAQAADWSRRNPGVSGDDAVQMVQDQPWEPSVKALVAYPDVLARMGESPQWTSDLGNAFLGQQTQTMATVQALRQRAQASGYLRSDGEQQVYQQGPAIAVQPVYPQYMYVRYYDPLVVYGPWWWPAYRPVFWRPWAPRVVFVNHVNIVSRQVFVTRAHVWSRPWRNVPESQRSPIIQGSPRPNATWRPVPEAQRQPIIQSAPRPQWRVEAPRPQWRAEARLERPVSLAAPSRSFQPRQQAFQQSQRQAQGGRRS